MFNMLTGNRLSLSRLLFPFTTVAVMCFAFLPVTRAVSPPPDGGYPRGNTAEGTDALLSLTTGVGNSATGFQALFNNTTGNRNTAHGSQSLFTNTTGTFNTATGFRTLYGNNGSDNTGNGFEALTSNTLGVDNTATGFQALHRNITGKQNTATGVQALKNNGVDQNTADGFQALMNNGSGNLNVATGWRALFKNDTGEENTATGAQSLYRNTTGSDNTATGTRALAGNTEGHENTATGYQTLGSNTLGFGNTADGEAALASVTTGSGNIGLGVYAGDRLTTGSFNIDIGNEGFAHEFSTIRIGDPTNQAAAYIAGITGVPVTGNAVVVNGSGQLGVATSSARFKDEIEPMNNASEAILALKPVTFRYKKNVDPDRRPQFGLVAEQVERVNPDLVSCDADSKAFTVRYDAVNAMLLNEFLKEHRKVEQLETQIAALTEGLQKVSAQLESSGSAPQMVMDSR